MKKRLISKKNVELAYTKDLSLDHIDLETREIEDDIESLPQEMFEILGQVISFIENTNKLEGDNNENK